MKILNQSRTDEVAGNGAVLPYIALGVFMLIYVAYCLTQSSADCVFYFGKGGLVEDCSDSRALGYGSLAVASLMGVLFCILGSINYIKNKRRLSGEVTDKSGN